MATKWSSARKAVKAIETATKALDDAAAAAAAGAIAMIDGNMSIR
jgi:hypothetical protein